MDTNRKINVTVVIKKVRNIERDTYNDNKVGTLVNIENLLEKFEHTNEDIELKDLLHLLNASKQSHEIMADAYADVNREDLFDGEIESNDTIDEIINLINNKL
jgi:hypothetical protein